MFIVTRTIFLCAKGPFIRLIQSGAPPKIAIERSTAKKPVTIVASKNQRDTDRVVDIHVIWRCTKAPMLLDADDKVSLQIVLIVIVDCVVALEQW